MDPYNFLRSLDDRAPFLNGINGLNPLSSLSGLSLDLPLPTDVRGKGKIAREEAALEVKLVQRIAAGEWESLKPNSGKAIAIGDHHICVAYHEDKDSEYRIWEWHGHLLMFDDEEGYTPEYIYGNHFQPLEKKKNDHDNDDALVGDDGHGVPCNVGLGGIIHGDCKQQQHIKKNKQQGGLIVHRAMKKEPAVLFKK